MSTHEAVRLGSAIFNADVGRLTEEVGALDAAGIDFYHWDVFDGYFMPLRSSPHTIHSVRRHTDKPFEVHLGVLDPEQFIEELADAGVDLVILPYETCTFPYRAICKVRERRMQVAMGLAYGTPASVLEPIIKELHGVVVYCVVYAAGSRFLPSAVRKVQQVHQMIDASGTEVDLEAAGKVSSKNASTLVAAGATTLVLGSALHKTQKTYSQVLREVRLSLDQPPHK